MQHNLCSVIFFKCLPSALCFVSALFSKTELNDHCEAFGKAINRLILSAGRLRGNAAALFKPIS